VLTAAPAAAQGIAPAACLVADSIAPPRRTFSMESRCMSTWLDSLRSTVKERSQLSRWALTTIGGRAAVDAIRLADEKRAPESALPIGPVAPASPDLIYAMATTGEPQDVAFLLKQLRQIDHGLTWTSIHAAAITLGLLRVEDARDELRRIAAPSGRGERFPQRGAAWALERLDNPPCADSVAGDLPRGLVKVVLQCRPSFLSTQRSYQDASTGTVWHFSNGKWQERPRLPADSALSTLTAQIELIPEANTAFVALGMHCGSLCGEGWSYRLRRVAGVWRVISASFNWVS
jgi:hypothetical protein